MKTESTRNAQRVLVTGANGFIGRLLVDRLVAENYAVAVIVKKATRRNDITEFIGDLRDEAFVEKSVVDWYPQYIFHLAAIRDRVIQAKAIRSQIENNLLGTLNLFEATQKLSKLKAIVTLGTCEEYGNVEGPFVENFRELPVSAYSFSKQCVTKLCEMVYATWGLPVAVVRPTITYGGGQLPDMFLPSLINSLIYEKPFIMTEGLQTRDYIYVTDVVDALLAIAKSSVTMGRIINIGSGEKIFLIDLAKRVEQLMGKGGLLMVGELPYRKQDIMRYEVDCSLVRKLLAWSPRISLDEGLKKTIEWYTKNMDKKAK